MTVVVLGRFPPPFDGQALATERLAKLLEDGHAVERINTEPEQAGSKGLKRLLKRGQEYLRHRPAVRKTLDEHPHATVLWPAISPDPLGHLRDRLITLSTIRKNQTVYAVVHRGNFHRVFESAVTSASAQRLIRRIDGFVFLTQYLSDRCAKWIHASRRFVIPNTIDDELIFSDSAVALKQRKRRNTSRLRLLFMGHMLHSKGYLDVLSAISRLDRSGHSIEGHFVGQWTRSADRRDFCRRVRAEGLEDVVIHHGLVQDRRVIRSLYEGADILLLPTYYRNEAQPLVIIEALNAGVPVISTEHAGIPEMIRSEKEGLLIPPRRPEALASAVSRLSDTNFWERASSNARRRFLDEYAPNVVRRQWEDLITPDDAAGREMNAQLPPG